MLRATDDDSFRTVLHTEGIMDLMMRCGILVKSRATVSDREIIVRSIALHFGILHVNAELMQFKDGLKV